MKLDVNDYMYELPSERIALYPLAERDQSKLLVYDRGVIGHQTFSDIVDFLPPESALFFNETKVIPARLHFKKNSGAMIEIFLLHPVKPSALLLDAMQASRTTTWKCIIGNLKRWPENSTLSNTSADITINATSVDRQEGLVTFSWDSGHSFAEVLQHFGNIPLPPYLKRKAEETDKHRYQTVYSNREGAVAAPTAGLHFTNAVFESLKKKGIPANFLTLHVSAGTFQPIKVANAFEHVMHQEQVVITRDNVENLLKYKNVVAVGTTSLRSLESLYWYGARLIEDRSAPFIISQHDAYTHTRIPTTEQALLAILKSMDRQQKNTITGETSIYIVPGYKFKICNALITNFHQPGSTLILLVAAFVGSDWKKIYGEALSHGYRFLSYGDSSLLIPGMPPEDVSPEKVLE
jgi:S-adenosylmethionine:tRNA ribosyltransferase-isomerase